MLRGGRDEHSGSLRAPAVILAAVLNTAWNGEVAAASTDPDRGRDIAAVCASCHHGDAARGAAIPDLAGVDAATIEARMRDFRVGRRPSTIMRQIANGYTEAQIAAAAAWLSAQKRP